MDLGVEEVDAHQGQVGREARSGFSTNLRTRPALVQLGDAEALGVLHVRQEDLRRRQQRPLLAKAGRGRPGTLRLEAADEIAQVLLEEVVAQVHDEVLVAQELAGDQHGVGQPEGSLLLEVGDLQAPGRPVPDGRP